MARRLSFLFGFFVGCFVGWVLGILYAPQSGKETMDVLSHKAIELRERAEQAVESVREQALDSL